MESIDPTSLPPSLPDSTTPPPAPSQPAPAQVEALNAPAAGASEAAPSPPLKINYGKMLVDNKIKVFTALALVVVAGLGIWLYSFTTELKSQAPASPVTGELNSLVVKPIVPETVEPVAAAEESINRDHPTNGAPDAGVMLADGTSSPALPIAPANAQQRSDYRKQTAITAHTENTDTVTVTTKDAVTGQFKQTRVARQRVPLETAPPPRSNGSSGTSSARNSSGGGHPYQRSRSSSDRSFSAVTPQNQTGFAPKPVPSAPRPKVDEDGVLFETNDEINLMIAGLPDAVKAQYEKMSGRRFRPLPATVQQQAKDSRTNMAYVPGMDGFNTIRYRGSNAGPDPEESLNVPDIFYRCSIQGDQNVRSGSVVLLRLTEDATFNGITYPRNMVFSALANVETYRVSLTIDRLGPHRVKIQTYNYAYMPGIMIDPGKRAPSLSNVSIGSTLQQSSTQELSNAIAQSQQAANSLTGVAGRMAITVLGRLPKAGAKLRIVTLPDGYPLLLSKTQTNVQTVGGIIQGGINTAGGLLGQEGNPFQSLLMSGQGTGGYQGNPGAVPPLYYPAQQVRQAATGQH